MDEMAFGDLLRNTCLTIGVIGVLAGLDLFFGAKAINGLKSILDKGTNIIDKTMLGPHTEKITGVIVFVVSLAIVIALIRIKL